MPVSRRRATTQRLMTDIPLTPLIDTALTLLVIFMVTAPMMQNMIKVTLPKGTQQEGKDLKPELVVYVDAKNDLYWDGKKMDVAAICATVKTVCGAKKNQVLFVKADEKSTSGTVLELIDSIKGVGGIQHVALVTQKRAGG
jgi:biopolymer transport protein ExbD